MYPNNQDDNTGQPGPIMSSPNDQPASPISGSQTASRYFGSRSRRPRASRSYDTAQTQYVNQAPVDYYPTQNYYDQPRKSKKPLIIGIIAVAVIAIIAVVILTVPGVIKPDAGGKNSNLAELQDLVEKYRVSLLSVDKGIRYDVSVGMPTGIVDEEYYVERKEEYSNNLEDIVKLRKGLDDFGDIKANDEDGKATKLDDSIINLKNTIDARMSAYEIYTKTMIGIMNVQLNEGSDDSLKSLKESAPNGEYDNFVAGLKKYYSTLNSNKTLITTDECSKNYDKCEVVENELMSSWETLGKAKEVNTLFQNEVSKFNKNYNLDEILSEISNAQTIKEKVEDDDE